ncbi:MAG TPA: glycosyltransferase family 4 protein [Longimicrobiales bacterium]
MSRLRVLHCIYDDPANPWVGGGGALRVLELYSRLTDRVDATVATGAWPGARDETIEGVRYARLGVPRPYALSRLSYGAAATRLLERAPYDVGIFDFSGYTPIRLPRGRRTGIVVHMLHSPAASGRWGRAGAAALGAVERAMLRRSADVCITSDWMRRELEPLVRTGTRFHLVRTGVPDDFFAVERRPERVFLYYGRFDIYQKGLDVLLDAWSGLARDGAAPPLRMLGRGKDAARLGAMVAERGLGELVSLHESPSRAEVLDAMTHARALVHPSRFEGLPAVPAEAMAAGVPVVATRVGAVSEMIRAGGILIDPELAEPLRDAVRRLDGDATLRAELSRGARADAASWQWSRVADEHVAFLEAVAGRNG